MKKVFVDIDGTLSYETEGFNYAKRTPNLEAIDALRQIKAEGKEIILYSSRGFYSLQENKIEDFNNDYDITKKWLAENNVPYDDLKIGKPDYFHQWDDKSSNQLRAKVLCFSGGVDSLVASYYLGAPKLIYFDLDTPYTKNELNCIKRLSEIDDKFEDIIIENSLKVGGSELKLKEKTKTDVIPFRNLMLLSLASKYGSDLYLTGIAGDNAKDKTPAAFSIMQNTLQFLNEEKERNITISSPFWQKTKGEIIKWLIKNNDAAEELLKISMSCYSKKILDKGCGVCPACVRKFYGLVWAYDDLNMKFIWEDYFIENPQESGQFVYYYYKINNYASKRYLEMSKVHKILKGDN